MIFKQALRFLLLIIIVAAIGGVVTVTFLHRRKGVPREQEHEHPVTAPSHTSTRDGERIITLAPDIQEKSGIVVAPLTSVSHQEEISAYGTVLPLQDLLDVRNGYIAAQAQVEKTQAALSASRKEYERLKALHAANHNISDKALQAAEAVWRADAASARAAQEALRVVESSARHHWGHVLAEWLSDSAPAFDRLLQQQDVLVQLTVPPGSHFVSAPQGARVQAADGTFVSAKLLSPSPRTDPRIQGMSFFYLAPAQPSGLLQGMNVLAYLSVGPQLQGVIVPASAVVWWQGKAWVYAQKEAHRFVRREVSTEIPQKESWFVTKGLMAGELIVVGGAQLLLSEEFRAQIQVSEGGEAS